MAFHGKALPDFLKSVKGKEAPKGKVPPTATPKGKMPVKKGC